MESTLTTDTARLGATVGLNEAANVANQALILRLAATKVGHGHQLRLTALAFCTRAKSYGIEPLSAPIPA